MSLTTTSEIKPFDTALPCPCGSALNYGDCCGKYHQGEPAPTAEALMRSRFSAFFLRSTGYLLKTTWPRQLDGVDQADIHKGADATEWRRLDVLGKKAGTETDQKGTVEFKAWFLNPATGQEEAHHENSEFIKEDGRWYFIYPDIPVKMPGRNDPCFCGSGKKFKKCCR